MGEAMNVNFLRGVPADEALVPVAQELAKAYPAVLSEQSGKLIQYQSPGVSDFLGFHALKQTLGKRFGAPGDPLKQVVCTNGGMETISFLFKSFPRGSKIATDALTYDRVLMDIERLGQEAVGIPMSDAGADLDALEKAVASGTVEVFYQIGYHHNPLGLTVTRENLMAAAEICARHNVLHLVDIAYYELRYDGRKNLPMDLGKYPDTSCIAGSFTKTLSPGAKCGFGIFPEEVVQRLTPVISNSRLNPNYPTQAAINHLIQSGFYDRHLENLIALYQPRMAAANAALAAHLPDSTAPALTGGFFMGIWLKGIEDQEAFTNAVAAKGVKIAAGHVFAPGMAEKYGKERDGVFYRLTFPALTAEENEAGIKGISDVYRQC